jgi:hypothetical protein
MMMRPSITLPDAEWPLERRCATIGRFWALHWSAIQLLILRDKGAADLARFKYSILRRHQRSHFLPGVAKLGIDRALPPAVIAARYHYFSNAIGGLPMEYIEESPRKVWIRYLPPAWSWPGTSLFAVPASVQLAMFEGWHPFNGPSLGAPGLGFVVTKLFQHGDPYDEGYFVEHDRALDADERFRFEPVRISPDFDPARAPQLDPKAWPPDRLAKARRNFALGYMEDGIETAIGMYGVDAAAQIVGLGSRLIALQFLGEFRRDFGATGSGVVDLVRLMAGLAELAGEKSVVTEVGPGRYAVRRNPKPFAASGISPEIRRALFEFVRTSAKIISPRIQVTFESVDGAAGEAWTTEETAERTF